MNRHGTIPLLALLLLSVTGCDGQSAPGEATRGRVDVALDQFGVGSAFRPGEYVGIRVLLNSGLDEPTDVWVQWEVPNGDGDIAEYGRRIAVTPGREARLWLYAKMPPDATGESVWPVRVFEYRDGERRADVGGALISPDPAVTPIRQGKPLIHRDTSLIAIMGTSLMGLDEYTISGTGVGGQIRETNTATEMTRLVAGLEPDELPDRWEGLLGFEAVIWANGHPQDLETTRAEALLDYIERGGHLVIVLPAQGDPWGIKTADEEHELQMLIPPTPPREDIVKLADLQRVLTKSRSFAESAAIDRIRVPIKVFQSLDGSFDAIDGTPYVPLMTTDDGRVVAVQRQFGHGRVTLLGMQPTEQMGRVVMANGLRGVPQADVLWNRILGRRGARSQEELMAMQADEVLATPDPIRTDLGGGALVRDRISMSQKATQGLLLAIVLFLTYFGTVWASFFVLRQRNRAHLAWLIFAAAAAAFTALAWGGVSLISSKRIQVQHLTFLDHIVQTEAAGDVEQRQHAVGWFSAYLPGYGQTEVTIDSAPGERDLLTSWTPPGIGRTLFTNVDRYVVDVQNGANSANVPTRSTATQFYANWQGGLRDQWAGGMIQLVGAPEITMLGNSEDSLSFSLQHNLPGRLRDVMYIWIRSSRPPLPRYAEEGGVELPWRREPSSGRLPVLGHFVIDDAIEDRQRGQAWNTVIAATPRTRLEQALIDRYYEPFENANIGSALSLSGMEQEHLSMLSLFDALQPPRYIGKGRGAPERSLTAMRRLGRELDISSWMSRPCLIVIAFVDDSPMPIPLKIEGERPESTGLTIIRWICPLPFDEDLVFDVGSIAADDAE